MDRNQSLCCKQSCKRRNYRLFRQCNTYYDKGRTNEEVSPINKDFEYDARGNVTKEAHSEGDYITYEYDKNDRIVTEHIVNSYTEADELREYTYDSVGNLVTFDISGYTIDRLFNTLFDYYYCFTSLGGVIALYFDNLLDKNINNEIMEL